MKKSTEVKICAFLPTLPPLVEVQERAARWGAAGWQLPW